MRHILILISIILLPLCSFAQNRSIKAQAVDMANAFMKSDFNTFIKYAHPDVVAMAGGKQQLRTKMDSAAVAMKQFNVRFKKYTIGNPGEVIQYKDQLQTIVPQSTVMLTPFGEIQAESSLIAISKDKGKTWWFIDTNLYSADRLKKINLDLSPKLVIPARTQPKIIRPEAGK